MGRYVKKKKCWNVFVHVGAIEENPPWAFSMETRTRVLTAISELSVSSAVVLVRAFGKPLTHSKRSKWKAFGRNFFPSFASFFIRSESGGQCTFVRNCTQALIDCTLKFYIPSCVPFSNWWLQYYFTAKPKLYLSAQYQKLENIFLLNCGDSFRNAKEALRKIFYSITKIIQKFVKV